MTTSNEFLTHYGVKGMRWGVRKKSAPTIASSLGFTRGKKPRDKNGNIKKPSYGRQILVGSWANSKDRFTDPKARNLRSKAGKFALAGVMANVSSVGLSAVAKNMSDSNSSGALGVAVAGKILGQVGGLSSLTATGVGIVSIAKERKSRTTNQDSNG